jgi:hypothetical protein
VPEKKTTVKYLPAVRLGKRGKGVPRNFSVAERQRRRERMIRMNKNKTVERRSHE